MNILVTDASYKHSLGIVRSLGLNEHNVFLVASSKNDLCLSSKYSSGYIVQMEYSFDELIRFIKKNKIELIIPVSAKSVTYFVKNKYHLPNDIKTLLPQIKALEITNSKKKTYELANSIGIKTPKTYYPKELKEIELISKELNFPVVIKWLYEVGGNIVEYAFNYKELLEKYKLICLKHNFDEKTGLPMIQEFIDGVGVGFFALYKDGQLISYYQHKRLREKPITGGSSVAAISIFDENLYLKGKQILDELNWNGVAMVEFKRDKNGQLTLIEINGKFWGSHDLGLASGVDFPNMIADISQSRKIEADRGYVKNVKFSWPLNGDITAALKTPSRLVRVLIDLIDWRVKNNIWILDDPKPSLSLVVMLLSVAKRRFRGFF